MKDWVQSLTSKLRDAVDTVEGSARDRKEAQIVGPPKEQENIPAQYEDPPVVARLVVEIRSDGTRTIARGAMEDLVTGQRTTVQASGGSPVQLAASLAGSLLVTPKKLGDFAGGVLRKRLGRALGKKSK